MSALPPNPDPTPPSGLVYDIAVDVARHLASALGGALVAQGILAAGQQQAFLGSVLFLFGVGWSACEKLRRA